MEISARRRFPQIWFSVEEPREKESRDEASYVGPERDSSRFFRGVQRAETAQELHYKPDKDENGRRDVYELYEKEDGHECEYPRPRIKRHISAEHARDSSARSDHRYNRMDIGNELKEGRDEPAYDIKNEIPEVPHPAFDVVAEYIKEQHVPDKVEPASVKEHGGEEWIDTVCQVRIRSR